MKRRITGEICVLAVAMVAAVLAGCSSAPPSGNGNTNGNGNGNVNGNVNDDANTNDNANTNTNTNTNTNDNGSEKDALVRTRIIMDDNTLIMRPKAGDDLIVWGDSRTVYYIVPSQTDATAATGIEVPEGTRYAWTHFAVAGKKIALVTNLGEVRVYDTATGASRDFPTSSVLLESPQLSDDTLPGLTQASGDLFVTINDTTRVADGNAVKVIDVAGGDPNAWRVISFPNPIDRIGNPVEDFGQVAVDAGTRRAVGEGGEGLYIWDIDAPEAEPRFIETPLGDDMCCVNRSVQMRFEGGLLLYQQDPPQFPLGLGTTNAVLLDVDAGAMTVFDHNPATRHVPMALAGGSFGYAQFRESLDSQTGAGASYRSAIGRVSDAPDSTLASQFNTYALRASSIDFAPITQAECQDEGKLVGYGASMCITPDGSRWFLAGAGPIDSTWDYLQMSRGGAFVDFEDPDHATVTGSVMAADVCCSSDVVGFRMLREEDAGLGCSTNEEWVLGFIILDRLPD